LIIDEVLAVGDVQFQKKCLGKMENVSKNEGRTVLFVSHNMGVIAQLCNKSILLKNGSLVAMDNTKKVIDNYLMSRETDSNSYLNSSKNNDSKIYIQSVETLNHLGNISENFQFDECVNLRIRIDVIEFDPLAKISITLQNQTADYLSTLVEDIGEFTSKSRTEISFEIKFPSRIISPNSYAFRVAVFTTMGKVYDLQEMICPITIHDNGTKLSMFEGINYGSFFMDYTITK